MGVPEFYIDFPPVRFKFIPLTSKIERCVPEEVAFPQTYAKTKVLCVGNSERESFRNRMSMFFEGLVKVNSLSCGDNIGFLPTLLFSPGSLYRKDTGPTICINTPIINEVDETNLIRPPNLCILFFCSDVTGKVSMFAPELFFEPE